MPWWLGRSRTGPTGRGNGTAKGVGRGSEPNALRNVAWNVRVSADAHAFPRLRRDPCCMRWRVVCARDRR